MELLKSKSSRPSRTGEPITKTKMHLIRITKKLSKAFISPLQMPMIRRVQHRLSPRCQNKLLKISQTPVQVL